jgi:Pregnancy-associated plasma protein-A
MIPVVVHVVHRNDEQNISDAIIRNQIEIMNNDFRRRNVDRTNTPSLFSTLASDTRIQFYLACRDSQGNPHSGIIRKRTTHTNTGSGSANRFVIEDNTVAFDSESGSNSWDNTKYLNIYVADFYSKTYGDEILGAGHFPHQTFTLNNQLPNSTRSNVVSILQVDYKAFGSGQSYLTSGANFGRTSTHEIGHWLALRHIWGEDRGCTGSDLVDDTPNQAGPSPFDANACRNHPYDDGCSTAIMFMNFMDYSADNCMNLFTNGQKNRMRNCLDPNASADVRRTLTYDKVYIESSSILEYMSANEERTFTFLPLLVFHLSKKLSVPLL